ncbi:MAG: PH domain-containing protein [Rothia sp. (in: high G+C Gram-positive bacteria)]|nr:PH domain-containing protein [Rothia sp. (in: high G+C Gram-positive bacteria)]
MKIRGSLQPGEYALAATRAHGSQLAPAFLWAFVAAVAWSFSSSLGGNLPWLRYPVLVLAIWCAAVAVRGLGRWWLTSYIITTHRLVLRRGWGARRDLSIALGHIESVQVQGLAFMGAVDAAQMVVYSRGGRHVLPAVPEAKRFSYELRQAQQDMFSRP